MKKNYGVARREQAKKGLYSVLLAAGAIALFLVLLIISYVNQGAAGAIWGAVALIAVAVAGYGLWMGINSYHEPNKAYTLSKIGIILNTVILIGFIAVFIMGVRA